MKTAYDLHDEMNPAAITALKDAVPDSDVGASADRPAAQAAADDPPAAMRPGADATGPDPGPDSGDSARDAGQRGPARRDPGALAAALGAARATRVTSIRSEAAEATTAYVARRPAPQDNDALVATLEAVLAGLKAVPDGAVPDGPESEADRGTATAADADTGSGQKRVNGRAAERANGPAADQGASAEVDRRLDDLPIVVKRPERAGPSRSGRRVAIGIMVLVLVAAVVVALWYSGRWGGMT